MNKPMPTETKASVKARQLVGSFAYMLPDTEACRETVAALIDAALVELREAAREHVQACDVPLCSLERALAPWEPGAKHECF